MSISGASLDLVGTDLTDTSTDKENAPDTDSPSAQDNNRIYTQSRRGNVD